MRQTKKTKNLSWHKKKAWEALSKLTRLRAADENGYCSCVTCGLTRHWKEMQAGHWVPQAQGNAVKFDERNVHVQCYRCNINLGGNGPEYAAFMELEYGKDVMEELREASNRTVRFTRQEFDAMREKWEAEIAKLEAIK